MKNTNYNLIQNTKQTMYVFVLLTFLFFSCKKNEVQPDPNESKYLITSIKILKTNGDSLKAVITGLPTATTTTADVIATVADDGNDGKRFKVVFSYPANITPISVTIPGVTNPIDSIDFSTAKTFTIKFSNSVTTTINLTISEQAPTDPVLSSFTINNAERIQIDETNSRIDVRMPQGANLAALLPTVVVSPSTAEIVTTGNLDFTNTQTFTIKNGSRTKSYSVYVSDYGFTRVTKVADFSVNGNARPASFTTPETSVAIDPTGQYVFVSVNSKILKYDMNNQNATPTELNLQFADTNAAKTAPTTVLQIAGNYLVSCGAYWASGPLLVAAWNLTNLGSPVLLAKITLPTGGIFQNMQISVDATSANAYFINREPVRRSPKANPTVNKITIPLASLISGAGLPITSFTSTTEMVNYATNGFSDGPNMDLIPIPNNTTDFLTNSWGGRFQIIGNDFNATSLKTVNTTLLGTYVQGVKAFEYNRGKYAMFAITPGSGADNASNPFHSNFNVWDMTKKGYRQSIIDIETERTSTPATYTTWNAIRKLRTPLGTKATSGGTGYCQTAYTIIGSGNTQKLRVVAISGNNGFVVYDLD